MKVDNCKVRARQTSVGQLVKIPIIAFGAGIDGVVLQTTSLRHWWVTYIKT